jgi:hypothetical protein
MTCVYKYIRCVLLVYSIYTHDRDFESTTLLTEPVNERVAQPSSVPLPCNSCPLDFRHISYTFTVDRLLVSESIYCWCDPKGTLPILVQLNRFQVSSICGNKVKYFGTPKWMMPTPLRSLMLANYAYRGEQVSVFRNEDRCAQFQEGTYEYWGRR